jgi:L-fuconolactonase
MRIDAHQHFWKIGRFEYPWMPAGSSRLQRDFLPEDLRPILSRNNFDGSIAVQATTDAAEVEWLLDLATQNEFVLGVVGWIDLTSDRAGDVLDRLQSHPKFKGVRHPVEDETDDRWLIRPDVLRGLEELERRRIPYDLLIRPRHLPLVLEIAERFPDLPLVIDHMAKPPIRTGVLDGWAQDLERVAAIPHVYVKLSGMITEADWKTWTAEHLKPFAQHAWNVFGAERCIFGSDWPVCSQAGIWKEVLAGFTQALGPIRKEIRAGVMGENAARFYRLDPLPAAAPGDTVV